MTTNTTPPAGRSKGKMIAIGAAVLLLGCCGLFAISSMMGGGDTPATTQAPADGDAAVSPADATSGPTIAPYESEVPPTAAPAVGTSVSIAEFAWIVDTVTDHGNTLKSGNQFIPDETTSGKFVQVDVRVKTNGQDSMTMTTPQLVDSQGREFDGSSKGIMLLGDRSCILKTVNPGIEEPCSFIYEVPTDATGLMLEATGGFTDEPVLIDLGQ